MAPAHGLKLGQCGTRSPGAGVGPGLGFLIWVSREADQSPGWLETWLGSSSPDHISSAGFMLVHTGHPPCGESAPGEVSASPGEGVNQCILLSCFQV